MPAAARPDLQQAGGGCCCFIWRARQQLPLISPASGHETKIRAAGAKDTGRECACLRGHAWLHVHGMCVVVAWACLWTCVRAPLQMVTLWGYPHGLLGRPHQRLMVFPPCLPLTCDPQLSTTPWGSRGSCFYHRRLDLDWAASLSPPTAAWGPCVLVWTLGLSQGSCLLLLAWGERGNPGHGVLCSVAREPPRLQS